jgi:hypothetical protein
MPFKSKAQRRKFAELLMKGEISEETYEEWNRSTGKAELPERVRPRAKRKTTKARSKSARSRKTVKRSAKGRAKKAKGKRRTRTAM